MGNLHEASYQCKAWQTEMAVLSCCMKWSFGCKGWREGKVQGYQEKKRQEKKLLEEEEVGIYINGLEVILSVTSVTDIGSKPRVHFSFACTQAKLGISLKGWRIKVVLVKQTSYTCYLPSTIKHELCLFLTILLWNWNFCCDCIWLRYCVCWLNGVWVTYRSVQTGRNQDRCTRNGLKKEREIANTHTQKHTLSTASVNSPSFMTQNKCGQQY